MVPLGEAGVIAEAKQATCAGRRLRSTFLAALTPSQPVTDRGHGSGPPYASPARTAGEVQSLARHVLDQPVPPHALPALQVGICRKLTVSRRGGAGTP